MQKIMPCLWFHNRAGEASEYYVSVFDNSKIDQVARFGEAGSKVSGQPKGEIMTAVFELEGQKFMALNGCPDIAMTPALSFMVYCEGVDKIDRLWGKLSDGGKVLMPLDKYPFAERYGWVEDRYGVSWQLILAESTQKISPCFLFVNNRYGQAESAMDFYMSQFEDSNVAYVSRHAGNEHGAEGGIAYAKFSLEGQDFVVMDGPGDHKFSFSPAISLIISCESQQEIDHFWGTLTEGGEEGQCGWLSDKYGVSWQVVPRQMGEWVGDGLGENSERLFSAMFGMRKLDMKELKLAVERV